MEHPIRSRAFILGFITGIILCGFLNYYTYLSNWCTSAEIFDCYIYVGFPVPFGVWQSGFLTFDGFIWLGVVVDIFFAVTGSVIVGLIFRYLASKIRNQPHLDNS